MHTCSRTRMVTIYTISLVLLVKTMFAYSGRLVMPMRGRGSMQRFFKESRDIGSLLERQIPDDIIYDLIGRMKLITRDEITDEYYTFTVKRDRDGIPYVRDPGTGHKYVVVHSLVRKGIDIYRIMRDKTGKPIVADWATMNVNTIKLNKYGEVELWPI